MNIRSLIITAILVITLPCYGARIKDITEVVGLHDNTLMGMGLVVGLQKTGDKSDAAIKALQNVLKRHRFRVSPTQLSTGNVALVMVTTTLPSLARKGSKIDVRVSSIGDATSLSGGILLATFLRALNKKVYAVAQGILGQSQSSLPTVAMITNGAVIEKEVPISLISPSGNLSLRLKNPDFNTARRIAEKINEHLGQNCSYAEDMTMVRISVPGPRRTRIAHFIAEIFSLTVEPDTPARIVINERTGTIIIGHAVTISPVTIAHNQITVRISAQEPEQKSVTVQQLAQALFALRVSPRDLVAIFRMLKRAGALHAELIIS